MTSQQARRRWFGAFYLALAAMLLIWGQTLLQPHLRGWVFLCYWLACFVFTVLAMVVAWLDLRAVQHHLRQQQIGLIEKTLRELGPQSGPGSPAPPRGPNEPQHPSSSSPETSK
jgi:hypothetical protein